MSVGRGRARLGVWAACVAGWCSVAGGAMAAETQMWISDAPADYAKAEARGVLIGLDGVITIGPRSAVTRADSLAVIWAVLPLKDGSVAMAGDGGRIDRWTESGGVRPWVRLAAGQVLSLAQDGDGLVAGTGPDGAIYRVGARGDTALLARTGERYVWGLAPAGRDAWYAATGTRGRLMRIERAQSRIVLDSDESNLVALISDGRGGAYAGGDSKGRVLHVAANGATATVYDAAEDEVRALAIGADGALYAAALSATAVAMVDEDRDDDRDEPARPQPVRSAVSGGRATVYRIVPDSSAAAVWTSTQPFVYALAAPPARGFGSEARAGSRFGVIAATGQRAGVYAVTRPQHAEQWLSAPEGQITALTVGADGTIYAATSNPGALWRLGPGSAERGELISPVHDARRFARFGRPRWRGESGGGRVTLATRTGNTDPPDTTWTRWEDDSDRARTARFLQWRLTLAGGRPRVDAVEVAWREQNLAPRIEELLVAPQGIGFREGELQPRSEPVTQTLPGGQRVEYSTVITSQRSLRELPAWARGLRTLQWKGSDPNGDALRYRVDVRTEPGGPWMELGDELEATSFTWDTQSLPDGRYRIRVTADDSPGNAVGEQLNTEVLSEPFTVDNTAPALTALEARADGNAALVTGRAEDGQSILTRLEVSIDDGDWRTITPEGGLADERALQFRARLPDLEAGEHTVAVRAVDQAGNAVVRATRMTMPRGR